MAPETFSARLTPMVTMMDELPQAKANEHVAGVLESLKTMTTIESGSRDLEGLAQMATLISERLKAAGMTVQTLPAKAPDEITAATV